MVSPDSPDSVPGFPQYGVPGFPRIHGERPPRGGSGTFDPSVDVLGSLSLTEHDQPDSLVP